MKVNFINLVLCDNDFAGPLEKAAQLVRDVFNGTEVPVSEQRIKRIVINLLHGLCDLREAGRGFETYPNTVGYLQHNLRVTFQQHAPTEDHDGGSVCIDMNTGNVWRY